ncbi:MAG: pseudouridine synthase, partial [Pseudomonadota bacterium]
TLADFVGIRDVYPAGRLDYDSEGLLLLTNDGRLQARISEPRQHLPKRYWVQVEGPPTGELCAQLISGVTLKDGPARAVSAREISAPRVWDRQPPVRERLSVPDHWVEIVLDEGRNRQVRRMTAAAGYPTLRLIRHAIGPWSLRDLVPGAWHKLSNAEAWRALAPSNDGLG